MNEFIYPQIFNGKTDEEIIEFCKKYLGECDVDQRYFPNALANGNAEFNYADRLWTVSKGYGNSGMLDASEQRDLGVTGNPGVDLKQLALKALEEEAIKVSQMGLNCTNKNEMISTEEITRRVSLLHDCCSSVLLEEFVNNSIYRWIYTAPIEEIEEQFAKSTTKLSDSLKRNLPQFFKMIEILLDQGIELDSINMKDGCSVLEVYNLLKDKFSRYIKDGEIVDPDEIQNDQEGLETDEVKQMVEDTSDNDLSPEEIQKLIEENNRTISELMAKNKELMDKLMNNMNKGKQQNL